jgi:ppGpp synthetase/RelA/SpoT-type nucleotidyltranferase
MSAGLQASYEKRYREVLIPAATNLQAMLASNFAGVKRVDRIAARAKSPDRFLEKARKREKDGSLRYRDPLGEIQDQIGARIIVFYTSDIEPARARVLRYFRHIEEAKIEPESEAEFGYFGRHYILALPEDTVPRGINLSEAPPVFELQVRTLFQHAWSEAEHDIGYKPTSPLTPDQKRRFAFTAAQAWGADLIFQGLYDELKGDSAETRSSKD